MGYGIKVEISGDYALFTRPETKVERFSYNVITPSAARGILEAIYFKPAIRYKIDRIVVYNEPCFTNVRRNEVSEKILCGDMKKLMGTGEGKAFVSTSEIIQQRASTILRDVRYVIEAHFEMTGICSEHPDENEQKHYNIMLRRLRNGQCFHNPYLGCREFPAKFKIIEGETPESDLVGETDFGLMLYDMDYTYGEDYKDIKDISPTYFHAIMKNGVIDLKNVEIVR